MQKLVADCKEGLAKQALDAARIHSIDNHSTVNLDFKSELEQVFMPEDPDSELFKKVVLDDKVHEPAEAAQEESKA